MFIDISYSMLNIGREREAEDDLIHVDLGDGTPFKPGAFDRARSITILQWLCNVDKSHHNPIKRLYPYTHVYVAAHAQLFNFMLKTQNKFT